jgi:PAS domain S-box-containing protein
MMNVKRIAILLVEDSPGDARLIQESLAQAAGLVYHLDWAATLEDGIARLKLHPADVVLLDLGLPGSYGLDTVRRWLALAPSAPALVVLSGLDDEEVAVQAVQSGAQDYLVKGQVDTALLVRAIRYAIERSQAGEALRQAHGQLEQRVAERTAALAHTVDALHAQILERQLAEEMLRKREQEFRTLAENSPDMVVRYGRDGRRFYVNPAYEQETGVPASVALQAGHGAQWQGTIAPDEYQSVLQRVIETGVATEIFVNGPGVNGQRADYAFHIVPERSPDGQVVGALAIGRNITELKRTERCLNESRELLRQLAARNETQREAERKALTREIHDEMGQYLSALRLGISLLGIQFGNGNPALEEQTRRMVALVDSVIKVVRDLVARLRPAALDMGIVSALEWLVDEFSARGAISCSLQVDGELPLDEQRATELFRIVQESLTNIRRHARASAVEIVLGHDATQYVLEVSDNGRGFDPSLRDRKSFGLVGIRERALALGGEAEIASAPGRGTRIKVCFPIHM